MRIWVRRGSTPLPVVCVSKDAYNNVSSLFTDVWGSETEHVCEFVSLVRRVVRGFRVRGAGGNSHTGDSVHWSEIPRLFLLAVPERGAAKGISFAPCFDAHALMLRARIFREHCPLFRSPPHQNRCQCYVPGVFNIFFSRTLWKIFLFHVLATIIFIFYFYKISYILWLENLILNNMHSLTVLFSFIAINIYIQFNLVIWYLFWILIRFYVISIWNLQIWRVN